MRNVIHNVRHFFTAPVASNTLGLFRIAVAGFAFVQALILLPDWLWLYGPEGLVPWEVSETLALTHMPTLSSVQQLLSPLHVRANETIFLVTGVYLLSLLALIAGFKTRVAAVLAWLMHLILNTTGHFTAYGVETFTHISLFYCMVLPTGSALSLDTLRERATVPAHLVTLSVRVIQIHLCIMYMASGLEKAMGAQWWNGEAIWIAMQQDQFRQVNIDWMAGVPLVPTLLCWGTLAIESLYPFGMLWNKTRKFWLIGIVSMHLFIALFLGLQLFGALMILLNLSVFGNFKVRNTKNVGGILDFRLQIADF